MPGKGSGMAEPSPAKMARLAAEEGAEPMEVQPQQERRSCSWSTCGRLLILHWKFCSPSF